MYTLKLQLIHINLYFLLLKDCSMWFIQGLYGMRESVINLMTVVWVDRKADSMVLQTECDTEFQSMAVMYVVESDNCIFSLAVHYFLVQFTVMKASEQILGARFIRKAFCRPKMGNDEVGKKLYLY